MAKKNKKLSVGDVFTIPIDDDRVGVGQLVDAYEDSDGHFYMAIFDELHPAGDAPDASEVTDGKLAFLALASDGLLHDGSWEVVGRCEVDRDALPWPAYKEETDEGFDVVDHSGGRRRTATDKEAERLPFRTIVTTKVLEDALKARHGIGEVHEDDAELHPPSRELSESAVFDD